MNGPSLTSSTAISAPNAAGRDGHAERRERRREPQVEALGELRGGAAGEARPPAAARVRVERELRDDERRAADLEQRQVRPAVVVAEDPQLGGLAGEVVGDRPPCRPVRPRAGRRARPPISPTTSPSTRTRAPVVRWRSALTAGSAAAMTPCSAMNAVRHASASCSCAGPRRRRSARRRPPRPTPGRAGRSRGRRRG